MTEYFEDYSSKVDEPDPATVQFSIQNIDGMYIVTVLDLKTFTEYPGQCVVTHEGEIIFSDFSKDMTEAILGELDVPLF